MVVQRKDQRITKVGLSGSLSRALTLQQHQPQGAGCMCLFISDLLAALVLLLQAMFYLCSDRAEATVSLSVSERW